MDYFEKVLVESEAEVLAFLFGFIPPDAKNYEEYDYDGGDNHAFGDLFLGFRAIFRVMLNDTIFVSGEHLSNSRIFVKYLVHSYF